MAKKLDLDLDFLTEKSNSNSHKSKTKRITQSSSEIHSNQNSRNKFILGFIIIVSIILLLIYFANSNTNSIGVGSSTSNPSTVQNSITTSDLINPVNEFYADISSKKNLQAWNLLSTNFQNYAGGYDNFAKGYSTTTNIYTNKVSVQDLPNKLVYVNLSSTDTINGQNLIRTYEGTWKLIIENNQWKLDMADITLLDPSMDCNIPEIGIVKLKQSECSLSFACQLGNKWIRYTSRDQCTKDQNAQAPLNNNAVNITSIEALGGGKVKLTWNQFSNKVLYYTVYYGPSSGSYDFNTSAGNNTSIEVGGLPIGSKFYFTIQAGGWQHNYFLNKDEWANSEVGNEASIDVK